jgi:hypothetical protein
MLNVSKAAKAVCLLFLLMFTACSNGHVLQTVTVINNSNPKLKFAVDSSEEKFAILSGHWYIQLPKGEFNVKAAENDKVFEEYKLNLDPETKLNWYINPGGEASYAFINISGLYKGGGVFSLANSKDFVVQQKNIKEKTFSFNDVPWTVIGGSGLPKQLHAGMGINGVTYLMPIKAEWSDEEILQTAAKFLAAEKLTN